MDELLLILSLCLKLFTVYFAAVAVYNLKKPKVWPPAPPQTRFAVVIAARNEEAVIGDLVRSVLHQQYPVQLRDVFVVPNNCTDQTASVAREAGAEIIHCLGNVKGKGDALHTAFHQLRGRGYDAFLVFDADNTLSPDYLARMNDAIVAGAKVIKSRTKAANPTDAGVAGCYGLYNTCFDLIWSRPRAACGLSAKLIGTGFGFTADVLEEMGGWNTSTIAEDAEFAARCAGMGYRVSWVPEAVNYDEEPTSFWVSLRQRKRWCSGVMQVAKQELPRLWRGSVPRAALRWDMTMFLLAPFGQAVSALLLLGGAVAALLTGGGISPAALVCLPLYAVGGVALAVALCLLGGYGLRGMWRTVFLFPLFMATWLPLQVISLFKDTKRWHAIAHGGCRAAVGSRM